MFRVLFEAMLTTRTTKIIRLACVFASMFSGFRIYGHAAHRIDGPVYIFAIGHDRVRVHPVGVELSIMQRVGVRPIRGNVAATGNYRCLHTLL